MPSDAATARSDETAASLRRLRTELEMREGAVSAAETRIRALQERQKEATTTHERELAALLAQVRE